MTETNGVRVSDAEWLLQRKLKLAEQLSCRGLFDELATLDDSLEARSRERNDVETQLTVAQADLQEAAALAALEVEGKNETERKARLAEALKHSGTYQLALSQLRSIEAKKAELDADLEALKRRARRVERRIEYQSNVLRFLGG